MATIVVVEGEVGGEAEAEARDLVGAVQTAIVGQITIGLGYLLGVAVVVEEVDTVVGSRSNNNNSPLITK